MTRVGNDVFLLQRSAPGGGKQEAWRKSKKATALWAMKAAKDTEDEVFDSNHQ